MKLKKGVYVVVLVLLLMTSCAHLSPYLSDNPIAKYFDPSEGIIYSESIKNSAFEQYGICFDRLTASYDEESSSCFGIIEGKFSRTKLRLVLNASGLFTRKTSKVWHSINGYSLYLVSDGVVVFSNYDISSAVEKLITDKKQYISDETAYLLSTSDRCFYTEKKSDLSCMDIDIAFDKFKSVLCIWNNDKADFEFALKDKNDEKSLLRLLKTYVVTNARKEGIKLDNETLERIVYSYNESVYLKEQNIDIDFEFNDLFN